ncbi:MAG: winged helix-turn-helix transcriptional regulator [Thermoleophilia bacterium]|nr:winged helix-turn-helix transcriptional regulator [Thermoleophilia bacterium]
MTDPDKLARIFKVLSVNTRVRMVALLKERPTCVNALARQLEVTPAAVSQHLRILRDADIVVGRKRGYFVHYALNEATLREWSELTEGLLKPSGGEAASAFPADPSADSTHRQRA